MREPIERLARELKYQFSDVSLLQAGLTHRSASQNNNERQEFLGDSILGFVIADELYVRFPDANEGELSRLRAKLVKKDSLAIIARDLDLGHYLFLGPGELRSGGHSRDSILADAVEAIIAAVYLDSDYPTTRDLILRLFETYIRELPQTSDQKDPKTKLQEILQAKKLPLPEYSVVEISGLQHQQTFKVVCTVSEIEFETIGTGNSKRSAEQSAASKYLEFLSNA